MAKKKKMGRPKISIDFEELDKLCALQCTQEEIAGWFRVSIETIETKIKEATGQSFPEYFRQKRGVGKISLRRKMWEKALNEKNPTMQIWLSKQHLGMKDKTEETIKLPQIPEALQKLYDMTPEQRAARLAYLKAKEEGNGGD